MSNPLQQFCSSNLFTGIGYAFILLNCVILSYFQPLDNESHELLVLNLFIDVYFCAEFLLFFIAYGTSHFTGVFRLFDTIVAAVSLGDIILFIIEQFVDKGARAKRFLQLIRVLSIVRPFGGLKLLPEASGNDVLLPAIYDLVLNVVIPLAALVTYSIMSFGLVGNALQYRCVPIDLTAPMVTSNPFYQEYGMTYFLSEYNTEFCGYRSCFEGYACQDVGIPFHGVYADFTSPWTSFVSNMSFITMRGWPTIFWAIHDTAGIIPSLAVLIVIICTGSFLIFNMFIAVLVGFFKLMGKHWERITWITVYPGNIESVSELELLLWAKRNVHIVEAANKQSGGGVSIRALCGAFWTGLCWRPKPTPGIQLQVRNKGLKKKKTVTASKDVASDKPKEDVATGVARERQPISLCVPQSQAFITFRKQIRDPFSQYNLFFLVLIVLNIFVFAMNSTNVNNTVEKVVLYSNIIFAAIFGLELTISLVVMGPFLFFNSVFNILDSFCVIFALFSLGLGGSRFINIYRVLRIFRPIPTEPKGTLREEAAKRTILRDTSLHFVRMTDMLYRSIKPILTFFAFQYCAIFVFAIISMRIFPKNDDVSIAPDGPSEYLYHNSNLTLLVDKWSGQYQSELNFNVFSNAYVTIYNVMYLNSWYFVMVNNMLKNTDSVFWFFFIWIMFSNFLLAPVLFSLITVSIEKQAVTLLKNIADENKSLFDRLKYYTKKSKMHKYFQLFKHNTRSIADEGNDDRMLAVSNTLVEEPGEETDKQTWFEKEMEKRSDWSFFIFSRKNRVRRWATSAMHGSIFNLIVFAAVVITVIFTLKSHLSNNPDDEFALRLVVIVIFGLEMFTKILALGLVGAKDAYMYSPFNIIDLLLNLMIVYTIVTGDNQYSGFLIVRISKFPAMIRYVTRSKSLGMLYVAVNKSARSMVTITLMVLCLCLFFAVYGLQLWKGGFGYCTDRNYPEGQQKQASTALYPTGCSGYAMVYNSTSDSYSPSTDPIYPMQWVLPLDHFDDIFHACKSVFRVVMMNDWAGIVLSGTSYTGSGYEPSRNASPAGFIYFMLVSSVAVVFNILFAGVIYFHYFIEILVNNRKYTLSQDDVIWLQLEVALSHSAPISVPKEPDSTKEPVRAMLHTVTQNIVYKMLSVMYAFFPVLLLLGAFKETYGTDRWVYIDNCLSAGYVLDYLVRLYATGRWRVVTTSEGAQEVVVVILLMISIVAVLMSVGYGQSLRFCRYMVLACIMLRLFRLSAVFPQIAKFFRIFTLVLKGYLPLVMSIFCVLLFYGVIGHIAFKHVSLNFDDEFLTTHLNFGGYFNSVITLLAMATGNMYSEVVTALRVEADSFQQRVAIEMFFTSFYILITVLIKSVVILLISKFLNQSGDQSSVADEQLSHFRRLWRKMTPKGKSPRTMNWASLNKFLTELKYPLGLKGNNTDGNNYMVVSRFKNKVLSFLPGVDKTDDEDLEYVMTHGGKDEVKDMATIIENEKKKHFRFQDILVAVHKNFVMGKHMDGEEAFQSARVVHKQRLRLFRLQLAILVLSGRSKENKDPTMRAAQLQLMLQRFDPGLYKETFTRLLNHIYHFLQQSIQSLGFEDFDGFVIIYMRKAVRNEYLAAENQLKVAKLLNPPSSGTAHSQANVEIAQKHFASLCKLSKQFDALYNFHIKHLWRIATLRKVITIPERKASVTAIALDQMSNFYVAFDTGRVRIWKNNAYNGQVDEATVYRPAQTLELKHTKVQSLMVSPDLKRLYIGKGYSVLVYNAVILKKQKKPTFVENSRMDFHSDTINSIVSFDNKFVITGSKDGYVALWPVGSSTPIQSHYAGSAVFCVARITVTEENVVADEVSLTDAVVCGMQSGALVLLPLPLTKGSSVDGQVWNSVTIHNGVSPISSLCFAWGFVYVGCADGSVTVYASVVKRTAASMSNPITMVSLIRVNKSPVHSGPVTGLQYSGGHLLSASHDFSVLPWTAPAKLSAKTENEFRQEYLSGLVFHNSPIIAMAANSKVLVTGDEEGKVIITAPKKSTELLKSDAFLGVNTGKNKVRFSFLEHDFKDCVVTHKGVVIEEEVYLNISNISDHPITIRCIPKSGRIFKATYDEALNTTSGCKTVHLPALTPAGTKKAVEVPANFSVQYRIAFSPVDSDRVYSSLVEFVVDESSVIKVNVKGSGVKPVVRLDSEQRLIDFGQVGVDGPPKTLPITLFNASKRDVVVNLNDDPVKSSISEDMHSLASRHLSVLPNCFVMPAQKSVVVHITYAPTRSMISVDQPLKFNVAGAPYVMATLRTRAQQPHNHVEEDMANLTRLNAVSITSGSVVDEEDAGQQVVVNRPPSVVGASMSEIMNRRIPGLRLLKSVEHICPGSAVNALLSGAGWGIMMNAGMLCLMHMASGLFVAVPNTKMDRITDSGSLDVDSARDTVEVQFLTNEATFYELWLADRKLDYGHSVKDKLQKIQVKAIHLYRVEKRMNGEGDVKVDLYGALTLELRMFAADSSTKRMTSTSYINIQKGFQIEAPIVTTDKFRLVERLDIVGIHKITTVVEEGAAVMFENFDQLGGDRSGKNLESASVFGIVRLALNASSVATHYEVRDLTTLCDPDTGAKQDEFLSTRSSAFASSSETTMISLEMPDINTSRHNLNGIVRDVTISATHKDRDEKGHVTSELIVRVSAEIHTMKYASHAPGSSDTNMMNAKNVLNSILPTVVHSCKHSVAIVLVDSNERCQQFTNMQNQIRSGYDHNLEHDASIFRGHWYFVLDNNKLKLVSANPHWPVAEDNSHAHLETTVASIGTTKRSKTSKKTATSAKTPKRIETQLPFSTMELEFDAHGLQAIFGNFSFVRQQMETIDEGEDASRRTGTVVSSKTGSVKSYQSGTSVTSTGSSVSTSSTISNLSLNLSGIMSRVKNTFQPAVIKEEVACYDSGVVSFKRGVTEVANSLQELPQPKNKAISATNFTGETTHLDKAPQFLSNMWARVALDVQVDDIKVAFKALMAKRESAATQKGDIKTPSAASLSEKIYSALADITAEFYADMSRGDDVLSGDDSVPKHKVIFSANKKASVLSFAKLELYMEKVPLPGSEAPMGKAPVEAVLKRLQRDLVGNVTKDNFRHWFETNSTRKDLLQLNESTIFARLLAEDMDAVFAFTLSSSGAAQGSSEYDDVDYSAQEALLADDKSPAAGAADRLEKVKRLQLWDQRQGRVVARMATVRETNIASPVGLSDGENTFRYKYLKQMALLANGDQEESDEEDEDQSEADDQSTQMSTTNTAKESLRSAVIPLPVRALSTAEPADLARDQSVVLPPVAPLRGLSRAQSTALYQVLSPSADEESQTTAGGASRVSVASRQSISKGAASKSSSVDQEDIDSEDGDVPADGSSAATGGGQVYVAVQDNEEEEESDDSSSDGDDGDDDDDDSSEDEDSSEEEVEYV